MARPRFNGQGFTNPLNPLGFNAESRHRVNPQLSGAFMSNETHFAETANGNQVFNVGLDENNSTNFGTLLNNFDLLASILSKAPA